MWRTRAQKLVIQIRPLIVLREVLAGGRRLQGVRGGGHLPVGLVFRVEVLSHDSARHQQELEQSCVVASLEHATGAPALELIKLNFIFCKCDLKYGSR